MYVSTEAGQPSQPSAVPAVSIEAAAVPPRAFAPCTAEDGALAPEDPTPLLHRPALQSLAAKRDIKALSVAIKNSGLLHHCPECFQWVSRPSYMPLRCMQRFANIRMQYSFGPRTG